MSQNVTKFRCWSLLSVILAALLALAPTAPIHAQAEIKSPEVLPDHSIVFRYYNPNAVSVKLYIQNSKNDLGSFCYIANTSDWPQLDMSKDEASGVWSITLPPQDPEVYNYHFAVLMPDEINAWPVLDPANPGWNGQALNSQVYVPGPPVAWEGVQDVPHGRLAEVYYPSVLTHTDRPLAVYTPPGYDAGDQTYPTIYLSHGTGQNHVSWSTEGAANTIIDNLIAAQTLPPVVVVMTNFNELPAAPTIEDGYRIDLIDSVIPFVEANYRVETDPSRRAYGGLSGGARRGANLLINAPETFGYIGIWSGLGITKENMLPKLNAIRRVPGIDVSVGGRDVLAYQGTMDSIAALDYYHIPHTSLITPGDCHTWYFWRKALYTWLTGPLFKTDVVKINVFLPYLQADILKRRGG